MTETDDRELLTRALMEHREATAERFSVVEYQDGVPRIEFDGPAAPIAITTE